MIRILSLVIAVCLVFGGCAFATEDDTEDDVNDCAHLNQDYYESFYNVSYVHKDESMHEMSGLIKYVYYCMDCGETVREVKTSTNKTENERHSFQHGICELCLYENTCPHKYIVPGYGFYEWEGGPSNMDNGDGTHTVSGYGYIESSEYCSICNESWETIGETGPIEYTERHFSGKAYALFAAQIATANMPIYTAACDLLRAQATSRLMDRPTR